MNAPSPFIEGTPIQYAWDSTSIKYAQECWRRYQYLVIEGYRSKSPGKAIALTFGILFHSAMEQYHNHRAMNSTHDEAVLLVCHWLANHPDVAALPTDADIAEMKTPDESEEESTASDITNEKLRTRYYLFRAFVWYTEQYRFDALKTHILANGKPAVELSFSVPVGIEVGGQEVLLSGHFDRVVSFNDQLFIKDYKTTKSLDRTWSTSFDLSHQMTGYTLAGQLVLSEPVAGVVIDGVALQVWGTKFARHFTYRSPSHMQEYLKDLEALVDQAERNAEEDHWPMNTSFCRFCEFKSVCRLAPEMRQGHLNYYFEKAEAWNPLKAR